MLGLPALLCDAKSACRRFYWLGDKLEPSFRGEVKVGGNA